MLCQSSTRRLASVCHSFLVCRLLHSWTPQKRIHVIEFMPLKIQAFEFDFQSIEVFMQGLLPFVRRWSACSSLLTSIFIAVLGTIPIFRVILQMRRSEVGMQFVQMRVQRLLPCV